jgi:hypothetical protein
MCCKLGETLRETQQYRRQTVRIKPGKLDPAQVILSFHLPTPNLIIFKLEKELLHEELGEGILDATKAIALASEKLMLVWTHAHCHHQILM